MAKRTKPNADTHRDDMPELDRGKHVLAERAEQIADDDGMSLRDLAKADPATHDSPHRPLPRSQAAFRETRDGRR